MFLTEYKRNSDETNYVQHENDYHLYCISITFCCQCVFFDRQLIAEIDVYYG